MKSWRHGLALLTAAVPSMATAQPRVYANPVLNEDFPDPATLRVGGTIYAYATGSARDRTVPAPYIRMSKSNDFVHWSPAVTVLAPPAWATGQFWAPHVVQRPSDGRYVMFFSAKADLTHAAVPKDADKCLGVAVAASPEGPFAPQPAPLRCGPRFFNIDPMAFRRGDGQFELYWGSAHQPVVMQPLAPDLLRFAPGSRPRPVIAPIAGDVYADLIEGSWVIDRGGYRYIFLSGSNCCGAPGAYAVTVARRKLPAGAWERYAGGDHGAILRNNAAWEAPGHNGIFTDGAGVDWLIYHARRAGEAKARVLLIDRIEWRDGWPRIAGDGPSSGNQTAPTP